MGRFFYLTRRAREPAPVRPPRRHHTPHPRRWCAAALTLLAATGGLYLAQANVLTAKGYQLEKLRQQIGALRLENRELESRALQLQSYQHLNDRIERLNLVPSGQIRYVSQGYGALSVRSGGPAKE